MPLTATAHDQMNKNAYAEMLVRVQPPILACLRALEDVQQTILFQHIASAQRSLAVSCGASLEDALSELAATTPPPPQAELHLALRQALEFLVSAKQGFVAEANWANFTQAFLTSRNQQCRALEILYRWRAALALIAPYFRLAGSDEIPQPPTPTDRRVHPPVGLMHCPRTNVHHDYALYVPEHYDPTQQWPLIIALHGAYGSGQEYIWSWLRAAASRGFVVLAPSAHGPTWSILQPALDCQSILHMLDAVASRYVLDGARVYVSGLSDGGTFSYLLGFEYAARFAALAPIAGVLSPNTDALLRARRGIELPLHVIHGVHDAIFPVQTVRSTNQLLRTLGYQLTYTELPEWGHALTSGINERVVLPWFEALHRQPP